MSISDAKLGESLVQKLAFMIYEADRQTEIKI